MFFHRKFLFVAVLAVILVDISAARANQSVWPTLRRQQATRIIGLSVENHDGEYLGKVKDFVLDLDRGEVAFAVVSGGGVWGIGTRNAIVPARVLSMATAKKGVVALEVSKARWPDAPVFRKHDLRSYALATGVKDIEAFYGIKTLQNTSERRTTEDRLASKRMARTSSYLLATDLIGTKILNGRQETLGKVSDLLVDLFDHKPPFLVFKASDPVIGHKGFALPLGEAGNYSNGKLILPADRLALENAKDFDAQAWADSSPARIFHYESDAPDNTIRNAQDRGGPAPTPLKQSENPSDLRITQKIRHLIFRDGSLSFTAKNIKVITYGGKVTLRGPVKRVQEKVEILHSAMEIAGAQNVIDNLEVLR